MTDHIFREYDIRGVVETDLTKSTVLNLGKAIGTYLLAHGIKEMVVGRDCRLSSESLNKSLIKGLLSTGIDVVDLGICDSPLLYFSLFHLNKNGGVMITGSHNPPEFNGFKICRGKTTIHGSEIQKLKEIINKNSFDIGSGNLSYTDILSAYWDTIAADIKLSKKLKVVIDAGNGTGGRASVELLKQLGCKVNELYCDMDGNFPNHHPDPTLPTCLKDLIETVKREKADLGISYDGDADRIGAVDEKGNIIWGDQLLTIFAREILKESPGATFISEVKASQNFYNDINQKGGKAIMWKTGHSLIKAKMKEENALLAGEMSGHMFFAHRYFGFDDAVYATCRLLEILSTTNAPLSSFLSDLPKTFTTPEIRVACPDSKKFEITEKVKTHFKKSCKTIDIDGVRILMKDGWGLVRSSNTQPVLVLRFESNTRERLDEIKKEVETVVKNLIS